MNIKIDSRKVKKGDIFVAIKTLNNDGHDYINDAIKNGASKVIADHGKYSVDTIIVSDTRKYLSDYLKTHYYNKISNLKLIGVTGTNGKTTTCFSIYQALNKLKIKCAYIGTIGFYMDDFVCSLPNTTPELLDIYEMLIKCAKKKYDYVVMEVSSHALSLNRVDGLIFDTCIFTNLTRDHLDYHINMYNYLCAKQKLFTMCRDAIINKDDQYSDAFIFKENNNYTYGTNNAEYIIDNIKLYENYSSFDLIHDSVIHYKTKLLGKYNIYNMVNVIILLDKLGIKDKTKKDIISNINPPKGRMQIIDYKDNLIIIDYAHTPDAILNVIESVKSFNKGKIYVLIGCGGNRDKTKRPIMATIAVNNSDYAIFTSDNPRNEKIEDIINDMICNIEKDNYIVIKDRKEAIIHGINMLNKNDILLILGKGHENYQIINDNKIHFDDYEVVNDYISILLK